jgi:hypothetical protein
MTDLAAALRSLASQQGEHDQKQDATRVDSSSFANSPIATTAGSGVPASILERLIAYWRQDADARLHRLDGSEEGFIQAGVIRGETQCAVTLEGILRRHQAISSMVESFHLSPDEMEAAKRFLGYREAQSPAAGRGNNAGPAGDLSRAAETLSPAFLHSSNDWWHFPGGQPA